MSSELELTEEQLQFWLKESHGEIGKPAIALIYPDGRIELDYHEEILLLFEEVKNFHYMPFVCQNKECDMWMKKKMVSDRCLPRECPYCSVKEEVKGVVE